MILKKIFVILTLVFFLAVSNSLFGNQWDNIWEENFDGYSLRTGLESPDGNSSDYPVPKWELDVSDAPNYEAFFTQYAEGTTNSILECRNTDGDEVRFTTEAIGIDGYQGVIMRVDLGTEGEAFNDNDYCNVYYQLDGSDWQLFANNGENNVPEDIYAFDKVRDYDADILKIQVRLRNDYDPLIERARYLIKRVRVSSLLYREGFLDYSNNTGYVAGDPEPVTSGDYPDNVEKWTLNVDDAPDLSEFATDISTDDLYATDTDGEVIFETMMIDISGHYDVTAIVRLDGYGDEDADPDNDDYYKVYYRLDGGAEIGFDTNWNYYGYDWLGPYREATVGDLCGDSLQIIVKLQTDINPDAYGNTYIIEQVRVSGDPAIADDYVYDFSVEENEISEALEITWEQSYDDLDNPDEFYIDPDGYLLKVSTSPVIDPIDGTDPVDDTNLIDGSGVVHIEPYSANFYAFNEEDYNGDTSYYFKIFPYYDSSCQPIDFATYDPESDFIITNPAPVIPEWGDVIINEVCGDDLFPMNPRDGYVEIYNTTDQELSLNSVELRYMDEGVLSASYELTGNIDPDSFKYYVQDAGTFTMTWGVDKTPDGEFPRDPDDWMTSLFPLDGGGDVLLMITVLPDKAEHDVDFFNDPDSPWAWDGSKVFERIAGDGALMGAWEEGTEGDPGEDDDPLPVTLSSFTATFNNEAATISWQTQSETNNQGWNLYRNESNNFDTAEKINSNIIEGAGTSFQPTNYEFVDEEVIELDDSEFWYWLESIANDGSTALFGSVNLKIENPDNPDSPQIPLEYGLHQNYPNPFNPTTEISFALSNDSQVELQIFNAKGQKIKTLVKGFFKANNSANKNYKFIWDGKNEYGEKVSSGIYIYKLVTRENTEVKKMLLLK